MLDNPTPRDEAREDVLTAGELAILRARLCSPSATPGEIAVYGKVAALAAAPRADLTEPSEAAILAAIDVMWPEPKEIGDTVCCVRPVGLRAALEAAYAVDFPAAAP